MIEEGRASRDYWSTSPYRYQPHRPLPNFATGSLCCGHHRRGDRGAVVWLFPATYLPRLLFPGIRRKDPFFGSGHFFWHSPSSAYRLAVAAALAIPFATAAVQPIPLLRFDSVSDVLGDPHYSCWWKASCCRGPSGTSVCSMQGVASAKTIWPRKTQSSLRGPERCKRSSRPACSATRTPSGRDLNNARSVVVLPETSYKL